MIALLVSTVLTLGSMSTGIQMCKDNDPLKACMQPGCYCIAYVDDVGPCFRITAICR